MCHDHDSEPPVDAAPDRAMSDERLVLEAEDGNRFRAFAAMPAGSASTGVVVLPDVRGLHRFYETLSMRLAESGYPAIAIDYFGRTAGTGERTEEFPYQEHVELTTLEGIERDVTAAVAFLRAPDGVGAQVVVTLGFCFGGRLSWVVAAGDHGLAGAIGFYGRPGPFQDGTPGPIQRASDLGVPVLALMAGDDPGIPQSDVEAWERALETAGVEHEVVTYPGAPHSFFDRKHEEFGEESSDAWRRVLSFLARVGS